MSNDIHLRKKENKSSFAQQRWLELMEWGAHFGCHQKPERSLFLGKWQMPVCARCFGFLLGSFAALPFAAMGKGHLWHALLALPLAVDGSTQYIGKRTSNNPLRYATGWLAGFGYTAALLRGLGKLLKWLLTRR